MTHISVGKLTIIDSDNGLSPERRQAIIWTNVGILLIGPLGTNFNEILIEILTFSFKKMRLNVSSAKRRPFCLGLNELILYVLISFVFYIISWNCDSSINHPHQEHISTEFCMKYKKKIILGNVFQNVVDKMAAILSSSQYVIYHLFISVYSTHRGRENLAAIFQTTFSNAFSWLKIFKFWLIFHWILFLRDKLTRSQHWFG